MGDVLKEIWEAANSRIRSPFIGSIIFVFLAVNWRPLFNLLFGDTEVLVRIAHFDNVTTWQSLYLWPVVGGVVFALACPWLKHVGALWAQFPNAKLKSLQDEAAHQHKLADLKREQEIVIERTQLESAQADMLIEAAKKEAEAEDVGGEELLDKLQEQKERRYEEPEPEKLELSGLAEKILRDIASDPMGKLKLVEYNNGERRIKIAEQEMDFSGRKKMLETQNAIGELVDQELLEGTNPWHITTRGYKHLDGEALLSLT